MVKLTNIKEILEQSKKDSLGNEKLYYFFINKYESIMKKLMEEAYLGK